MGGICDTCRHGDCGLRMDGLNYCDMHERPDSRYTALFGTPERTARTFAGICGSCKYGDCATCGVPDWADYTHDYDALLEWLRGDA